MYLHLVFFALGVSSLTCDVAVGDVTQDGDAERRFRELEEKTSSEIKKLRDHLKELEDWRQLISNEVKGILNTSKHGNRSTPTEEELQVIVNLIGSNSQIFSQLNPISSGGAVYVRWGHNDCPSFSEKVYNGTAAGANHRVSGGGADQLCLAATPNYDRPVDGEGTSRAYIYAIEYQIDDFHEYNSRLWYDVPCAVCKATSRYSMLMIPGTNKCPSSEWTLEYGGYLMADRSNHQAHHRSLHVCVDREMQVVPGSGHDMSDNNRGMLNLVEARCSHRGGGIPCGIRGQYVDSYEITCAVCTM